MRPVKLVSICVGLAILSGCNAPGSEVQPNTPNVAMVSSVVAGADRLIADNFRDIAFAEGEVAVVAEENGRLRTYWLVPCQNGTQICAGGPQGRAVDLTSTPDFQIVSGAYRGRDFYLSPGGDGMLFTRDGRHQLAWE